MRLLISATVSLQNPHQIRMNIYQHDYNHILPYKNAALGALSDLLDRAPQGVIEKCYPSVLEAAFIAAASVPDILTLKISQHPRAIAKKIYKYMTRS
jgi:hypothetical protein